MDRVSRCDWMRAIPTASGKKLAILKDPHTGAFAIIGLGLYLLLYAGAVSELVGADVWLLPGGAYAGTRLQRLFGGGISKGEKGRACR